MRGKIILFFLALSGALSLRAEIIVDNSAEATAGYSVPIGTNNDASGCLAAQEFTLPDTLNPYLLNQISLWLNPTNGGGSVSVNLWNVGADGNPTNEITFVASQIVTNIGEVDFVPTNAIYLSPGFSYYVVVSPTTAADNNLVSLAFTTSQNWDGSGELDNFASTQAGFW